MDYPNLPRAMDLVKGQPQGTEVEARADAEGAKDAMEVEMRELRHKERPQLAQTKRLYPQFQLRRGHGDRYTNRTSYVVSALQLLHAPGGSPILHINVSTQI